MEPRKNLVGVLNAIDQIPDTMMRRCPLVVIGGHGWRDGPIRTALERVCRRGAAAHIGILPDLDLAAAYAGARGVVFASFYEGQGLPAQEAAVSGVPVLTTKGSPMEELLGERAQYADPNDTTALAAGICRLIEDDGLGASALLAASDCAQAFHWDRCVDGTIAAYHRAVTPLT